MHSSVFFYKSFCYPLRCLCFISSFCYLRVSGILHVFLSIFVKSFLCPTHNNRTCKSQCLDNVIVISPDFESHLQRLQDVFERLQDAGLNLKPSKCELLQDEVHYLGHVMSADGVATDPDKVAAVHKWKALQGCKSLASLPGDGQYLPDFATVAKLLTRLISGDNPWI